MRATETTCLTRLRAALGTLGLTLSMLVCSPLAADVFDPDGFGNTDDTLSLEREGVVYILTYYNATETNSPEGYHEVSLDGFTVRVHLDVAAAETLTVMAIEGYQVEPVRSLVFDGDSVTVIISPLMF